jgi:hypothetical protein
MRTTLRALALLLGFYLVTAGLLAGLAAAALLGGRGAAGPLEVRGICLVLAFPLLYGLYAVRGERPGRPDGLRVTAEQQPGLWARAVRAAGAEHAPVPRELWLTDDAGVSLRQSSWLLGLVPGRRRLTVGVPLLVSLTEPQLDAALAEELGRDTRGGLPLAGLVGRNHRALRQVLARYGGPAEVAASDPAAGVASLFGLGGSASAIDVAALWNPGRWFGRISTAYARLCLRRGPADPDSRRRADTEAAAESYARFRRDCADIAWEQGAVPFPADVFPGYRAWLRSADETPGAAPDAAGVDLLADRDRTCAAVAERRRGVGDRRQLSWDGLAAVAGQAELDAETAPLRTSATAVLRRTPDLPALLDAIDAGRWPELADWIPRVGAARTVPMEVGRAMNLAAAADGLYSLALGALVQQGRGRWTLDPARGRGKTLDLDPGLDAVLGPYLDAAVADPPDTTALRGLLAVPAG